jgi:hypothetical protein
MVVHPRDLDLVIATHGRSIYVMDIEPLHQIADRQNERITGIKPEDIRHSNRWGSQSAAYRDPFLPKQSLIYFLGDDADNQSVAIEIKDSDGDVVVELNTEGDHGINVYDWNLIISENDGDYEFLDKGTYTVNFKTRRSNHEVSFEIK